MGSKPRVLVIIPAYNEEESIVATVESVVAAGYDYIVVNDGSRDATLAVCRSHGINVLNLPQNLGIGGAVQAGHKYALEREYDVDVQVDGDGQHDPAYIADLVKLIQNGADLAIGSRFVQKTDGFQSTFMRRVGITWLSFWIHLFTGERVTDPTSGFRASSSSALITPRTIPSRSPSPWCSSAASRCARRSSRCASARAAAPPSAGFPRCTTW